MIWRLLHPRMTYEQLGFLPSFLHESDPRPAAEQIDENYKHGGGWHPFKGFTLDPEDHSLHYPGDPTFHPLARTRLRDEEIFFYDYSWLLILQPDGSWEVSRID